MEFDYAEYNGMTEQERDARYPHAKVTIEWENDGSERLWARRVGDGLVMLDNDPLDARYQYGDLVRLGGGTTVREVVRRIFPARFGFMWASAAHEADDVELRRRIAEACLALGAARYSLSFFRAGLGFVLAADGVAQEQVVSTLSSVDVVFSVARIDDAGQPTEVWRRAPVVP